MKNNSIYKKIACALVLANTITVLGITGCNTNEDPVNTGASGTPESTEAPFESVDELLGAGDKDYFVPFQNPETSYCSITEGWGVPVRQQGMGGCYCYAAVSCMQTEYMKEHGELIDLNPNDIIYRIYGVTETSEDGEPLYPEEKFYISSGLETDLGGDVMRVTGALCADPLNGYVIKEANIYGSFNVDDQDFDKVSEEDIKDAVRGNGGVCLCVNYKKDCKYVNGYYTQNHPQNCEDTDHVALIVGWDDDFPADCFSTPASRNGAWLVQNSFGVFWGNCGYYWVSYDMPIPNFYDCSVTNEYSSAISFGRNVWATVYSTDLIEKVLSGREIDSITLDEVLASDDVAAATVYDHKGSVGAVGFWTTVPGQPYTIEIRQGEFGKVLATQSGTFEYTGYHTVEFEKPVSVKKFTVVVKTAGSAFFEGSSTDDFKAYTIFQKIPGHYEAKCQPGRSYIRIGEDWVDVTDPELMSRLGLDKLPPEFQEEVSMPGDPCITVLFK